MCHHSWSTCHYVLAYLLNKSIQIVQYHHLKSRHQSDQAVFNSCTINYAVFMKLLISLWQLRLIDWFISVKVEQWPWARRKYELWWLCGDCISSQLLKKIGPAAQTGWEQLNARQAWQALNGHDEINTNASALEPGRPVILQCQLAPLWQHNSHRSLLFV